MRLNLKDKEDYIVKTKDGLVGTVKDFIFDEKKWTIRYLLVDFGGLLKRNQILIPVNLMLEPSWVKEVFQLNISSKKLNSAPDYYEADFPIREYEKKLFKHLQAKKYWGRKYVKSMTNPSYFAPDKVLLIDTEYSKRVTFDLVKEAKTPF